MSDERRLKSTERYVGSLTSAYHYKVQGLDGKWHITYGNPMWNDIIKHGVTEAEADAFLKLLKEN